MQYMSLMQKRHAVWCIQLWIHAARDACAEHALAGAGKREQKEGQWAGNRHTRRKSEREREGGNRRHSHVHSRPHGLRVCTGCSLSWCTRQPEDQPAQVARRFRQACVGALGVTGASMHMSQHRGQKQDTPTKQNQVAASTEKQSSM